MIRIPIPNVHTDLTITKKYVLNLYNGQTIYCSWSWYYYSFYLFYNWPFSFYIDYQ